MRSLCFDFVDIIDVLYSGDSMSMIASQAPRTTIDCTCVSVIACFMRGMPDWNDIGYPCDGSSVPSCFLFFSDT